VTTPGGTSTTSSNDQFTFYNVPVVTAVSPNAGPVAGGTAVTLTGTDLAGASAVAFGGTAAASFTVVSATQVTATSPAGSAGTVDVTVTTPGGTSTTSSNDQFTFSTIPTIASVSPNVGSVNGDTSITISGTNLMGVNSVSVGGNPLAVTSDGSNSIVGTTPPGAVGAADVVVTTAAGTVTDSGAFNYECLTPVLTSADSATTRAGQASSFTVTTCSATTPLIKGSGLPLGLRLVNHKNGTATITGTPNSKDSGVYTARITATVLSEPVTTQSFVLSVDNSPVFKSKAKDTVKSGVAFSYPITTAYGYPAPTITTTSTLLTGVSLSDLGNGTATLSGTPGASAGGAYQITLTATNGVGGPVTQLFTLTVDQSPAITSASSDVVAAGVAMTPFTVTDTGYPMPTLRAPGRPSGIKFTDNRNQTGTISGTPKAAGTYTFTISANGKAGPTTQTFKLTVQ
jgi:hypothetical protein